MTCAWFSLDGHDTTAVNPHIAPQDPAFNPRKTTPYPEFSLDIAKASSQKSDRMNGWDSINLRSTSHQAVFRQISGPPAQCLSSDFTAVFQRNLD